MTPVPDDLLREIALRRELLTPAQLDEALAAQQSEAARRPLSEILADRGMLDDSRLQVIQDEIAALPTAGPPPTPRSPDRVPAETLGYSTPSGAPAGSAALPPPLPLPDPAIPYPSSAVVRAAPPAGRPFGKYLLQEELGRGGMGVVYRAIDTELRREVAIKTLHGADLGDREMSERLRREARTAANLDHPRIIAVHEVGEIEGVAYFAMEFVRGRRLDQHLAAHSDLGIGERAALVRAAAEAVAHAHERRVIHRDLKPGNLLVDEAGAVHVMDFGLARRLDEATRLTAAGQILGTAEFMPPEQINGEQELVGPPADVYALGAVLYHALTGRPPFTGRTFAEIAARANTRDPRSPRRLNAKVPVDLETICLKALQKSPGQRYPTAREFADDLARFVAGEAIAARPERGWKKALRWAGHRKALCALAAGAVLASCLAGASAWQASAARSDRARLVAEKMDALRATAALCVDGALTVRRAGGTVAVMEEKFLAPLERAARLAMDQDPALAEPHFHLGRLYRELNRFDDALREQELALIRDPVHAPALYERGVVCNFRYEIRKQWIERYPLRRVGKGSADAMAEDWRATADDSFQRLLRLLERDESWSHQVVPLLRVGAAARATAEGMRLALAGKDPHVLFEAALRDDPLLQEPRLGLIDHAVSEKRWKEVVELCTRGIEGDRGNKPYWMNRGTARGWLARKERAEGGDPRPLLRDAVADFSTVLSLDPQASDARAHLAWIWMNLGVWEEKHGDSPDHSYEAAVREAEAALAVDPSSTLACEVSGQVRVNWGLVRMSRGEDPSDQFAAALAGFDALLRDAPDSAEWWSGRGNTNMNIALYRERIGEDPVPTYEAALRELGKSLELDAAVSGTWLNRARTRINLGNSVKFRGGDPEPHYRGALADLDACLKLNPQDAAARSIRGVTGQVLGQHLKDSGRDPTEILVAAIADLDAVLGSNAERADAWHYRAACWDTRGGWESAQGRDPAEDYRRAIDDAGKALVLNPNNSEAWSQRAWTRMNWLNHCADAGVDAPPGLFEAAQDDFGAAIDRDPADANRWTARGLLRASWWRYSIEHGSSSQADYDHALEDFAAALKRNPNLARAWEGRGSMRVLEIYFLRETAPVPVEGRRLALADLDRELELDPGSALSRLNRSLLWGLWADQAEKEGGDGTGYRLAGIADLEIVARQAPHRTDVAPNRKRLEELVSRREASLIDPRPGSKGAWMSPLFRAGAELGAGRPARARALFEEGLRLREQAGGNGVDSETALVVTSHYNLACVLALDPAGRAEDRDAAFAHLEKAVELGWRDAEQFEKDEDLRALHADPRWAEMMGKMRK